MWPVFNKCNFLIKYTLSITFNTITIADSFWNYQRPLMVVFGNSTKWPAAKNAGSLVGALCFSNASMRSFFRLRVVCASVLWLQFLRVKNADGPTVVGTSRWLSTQWGFLYLFVLLNEELLMLKSISDPFVCTKWYDRTCSVSFSKTRKQVLHRLQVW